MKLIKLIKTYQRDIVFVVILGLVFVSGYNIGKIKKAGDEKTELKITHPNFQNENLGEQAGRVGGASDNILPTATPVDFSNIEVIVSKESSSGAYHFPWCPSVSRIKEENKVVFANEIEAQKAGYHLAGNCTK